VISGSVSGVVDGLVLAGCDTVPDVSKRRVASIFRVKQSCSCALNISVTRCVLTSNVALLLCDCKCLTGYCTGEFEFSCFPSGNLH
jgi:hypothetical protein